MTKYIIESGNENAPEGSSAKNGGTTAFGKPQVKVKGKKDILACMDILNKQKRETSERDLEGAASIGGEGHQSSHHVSQTDAQSDTNINEEKGESSSFRNGLKLPSIKCTNSIATPSARKLALYRGKRKMDRKLRNRTASFMAFSINNKFCMPDIQQNAESNTKRRSEGHPKNINEHNSNRRLSPIQSSTSPPPPPVKRTASQVSVKPVKSLLRHTTADSALIGIQKQQEKQQDTKESQMPAKPVKSLLRQRTADSTLLGIPKYDPKKTMLARALAGKGDIRSSFGGFQARKPMSRKGSFGFGKLQRVGETDEEGYLLKKTKSTQSLRGQIAKRKENVNFAVKAFESRDLRMRIPDSSLDSSVSLLDMFEHADDYMEETNVDAAVTHEKLHKLYHLFNEHGADGKGVVDPPMFRKIMREVMESSIPDPELDLLFMKVDTNCDGTVDWHEYLTYMMLECQERDVMNVIRRQPLPNRMTYRSSPHKSSVVCILFMPHMVRHIDAEGGTLEMDCYKGRYMSVSKEGKVAIWTINLNLINTFSISSIFPDNKKEVWVTDAAYMHLTHMLVLATTAIDILFFDIAGNTITRLSRLTCLNACAMCIDYFHDDSPGDKPVDILVWGDCKGGVSGLIFTKNPAQTVFYPEKHAEDDSPLQISFDAVLTRKVPHVLGYLHPNVHENMVQCVRYVQNLGGFISCSRDSRNSMYVGDLEGHMVTRNYFHVHKGINSVDYCKRSNVIVSGGYDANIRVWNPYCPGKAVSILGGHLSPIIHVMVDQKKEHAISIGENKMIIIHELDSQDILQVIQRKGMRELGSRPIRAAYYNWYRKSLIIANKSLGQFEYNEELVRSEELKSHPKPVTQIIFNPLFQHLISAGLDGMVVVWNMRTGERVMQFDAHKRRVHGEMTDVDITAMKLDQNRRRLITGDILGNLKMWNYNNGDCLRQIDNFDKGEITGIVWTNDRIFVTGWNKRVGMYYDKEDPEDGNTMRYLYYTHKTDILSLVDGYPNVLAAAAYDGDIMFWNLETECFMARVNAKELIEDVNYDMGNELLKTIRGAPSAGESNKTSAVKVKRKAQRKTSAMTPSLNMDSRRVSTQSLIHRKGKGPKWRRRSSIVYMGANFRKRQFTTSQVAEEIRPPPETEYNQNAVEKLLFLNARENRADTARLLAACADGMIRGWSVFTYSTVYKQSQVLGGFHAAHHVGDCVTAMDSNPNNEYLLTGDNSGYVKVWVIDHFCNQMSDRSEEDFDYEAIQEKMSRFPYFRIRKEMNRVYRKVPHPVMEVDPKKPVLVNSFQGHMLSITAIQYACINQVELIISSSMDSSIRLWTLKGEFLGIFGQQKYWSNKISYMLGISGEEPPKRHRNMLPTDVRRVASVTTLRVFNHGAKNSWYRMRKAWTQIHKFAAQEKEKDPASIDITDVISLWSNSLKTSVVNSLVALQKVELPKLETSDILGKSYKKTLGYKGPGKLLQEPKFYLKQLAVYGCIPYSELNPIIVDPPAIVDEIQEGKKELEKVLQVPLLPKKSRAAGKTNVKR